MCARREREGSRWERDVQGRVVKEVRSGGREAHYVYETTTSRLRSATDAKQQLTTHTYFLDDRGVHPLAE